MQPGHEELRGRIPRNVSTWRKCARRLNRASKKACDSMSDIFHHTILSHRHVRELFQSELQCRMKAPIS